MTSILTDVIVVGGGVAGLWCLRRLRAAGYDAVLLDIDKLGQGQTLASQGMIHGGQKYAIAGTVTDHARSIAAMPARWDACLAGTGEIDLSAVTVLSDHQVMWSAGGMLADLTAFAAAKTVQGDTKKLSPDAFPDILKQGYKGSVYALAEKVLDIKSLVTALAEPVRDYIYSIKNVTHLDTEGHIRIETEQGQEKEFTAQAIVFTAGAGNETAFSLLGLKKKQTQRRPLQQVMVKSLPYALYGHGITGKPKPRLTVTSHPDGAGDYIWYLGGNVAEKGAGMDRAQVIDFARSELQAVFPQINWAEKEFATLNVDRAEPYNEKGDLPAAPYITREGRVFISWPSKLTFTPALADQLLEELTAQGVQPAHNETEPLSLSLAQVGQYPWEIAQWQK